MIRRLFGLLSVLSWLGCGGISVYTPLSSLNRVGCGYGTDQCEDPITGRCNYERCTRSADCSKGARLAWPVCREDPTQMCRAEKPITHCGPGIGYDCYVASGVSNCTQLWEYRP